MKTQPKPISEESQQIIISFLKECYKKHGWRLTREDPWYSQKHKQDTLTATLHKDNLICDVRTYLDNDNPTIKLSLEIIFDAGDPELQNKLIRFFKDGRKIHR